MNKYMDRAKMMREQLNTLIKDLADKGEHSTLAINFLNVPSIIW